VKFKRITIPDPGTWIEISDERHLIVSDQPIIAFIEGDGIGAEITPAMRWVVDRAVELAYGGMRRIAWMEVFAGDKAVRVYGKDHFLPEETVVGLRKSVVGIKGPLATPVGGGIRSLNVALRQQLDQYVCKRPITYFPGVSSPVRHPENLDAVIFRENTEDLYAGIEYEAGSVEAQRLQSFFRHQMGLDGLRFPDSSSLGVKPISREGSERLMRRALRYALQFGYPQVQIVHSGTALPLTEGLFRDTAYATARNVFGAREVPGKRFLQLENANDDSSVLISDVTVNEFFRLVLERPEDVGIVVCPNVIGDYLSDFLAAQVGGIGISPGANLSDDTAIFEATHGTAPDIAGSSKANPSSLILSAVMMLRHIGWVECAQQIHDAMRAAISQGRVTADLSRDAESALSCTEFAEAVTEYLDR